MADGLSRGRSATGRRHSVCRRVPHATAAPDSRDVALGRSAGVRPNTGREYHTGAVWRFEHSHGQWTYLVGERMRKEDFIIFLEHL
jgi:hypothetical protein